MEEVTVKVKVIEENAVLPVRASELAGGFDVSAAKIEFKEPDLVICSLGYAMQPPAGYKITLVPRSSLTKTHWIVQNSPGLGDPDYTGGYQFRFRAIPIGVAQDNLFNMSKLIYPEFPFKEGERIGQIYLEEIIPTKFEVVDKLDETDRGSGGFGSTGK